MESLSSLRVVMAGHGLGQVFLDGVEVPRVRRLKVEVEAGELNRVTIETNVQAVEVEGEFGVTLRDAVQQIEAGAPRSLKLSDVFAAAEYITRPEISGKPRWLGVMIVAAYLLSGPAVIAALFWWMG